MSEEFFSKLLTTFEDLHKLPNKETDEWCDQRDALIQKSRWLIEYIHAVEVSKYCSGGEINPDVDKTKEIYVSSKDFPELDPEDFDADSKFNISFEYIDHYGSSALCVRKRIYLLVGSDAFSDNILTDEAKMFIDFFTKLGKKICLIHDYTYDTTREERGDYIDNENRPWIKLCVLRY